MDLSTMAPLKFQTVEAAILRMAKTGAERPTPGDKADQRFNAIG
jgi:hypothetical protein